MLRILLISFLTGVFGSTVAAQDATPTSKPTPDHKSSQSETDANRASNLIESIEAGDLSTVWRLLEEGANPDATGDDYRPLCSTLCDKDNQRSLRPYWRIGRMSMRRTTTAARLFKPQPG